MTVSTQGTNKSLKGSLLKNDYQGLFDSADDMMTGVYGVLNFVGQYFQKGRRKANDIFLIHLKVTFTNKVKEVELDTGLFGDTLVIKAPLRGGEKKKDKEERRIYLLNHFIQSVQESKLKTVLFLYSTLSPKAKGELKKEFTKRRKNSKDKL